MEDRLRSANECALGRVERKKRRKDSVIFSLNRERALTKEKKKEEEEEARGSGIPRGRESGPCTGLS